MSNLTDPAHFQAARRKLNLSQAELGRELGVEANTVARWEQGRHAISPMAVKLMATLVNKRRR